MLPLLRDKKVIFFDVGYTLDYPASGDWMLTRAFLDRAGEKLRLWSGGQIREAMEAGLCDLLRCHRLTTVEEEIRQFTGFYRALSDRLALGFAPEDAARIARDRALNMENYIPYPGVVQVLETLSRTHRLGVISDTWPSILPQLEHLGVSRYLKYRTFSCFVGALKPDPRIFEDALRQCGAAPEETVFIDDSARNLEGAAALGITPVLIAANPDADVETPFVKIRDLRELTADP